MSHHDNIPTLCTLNKPVAYKMKGKDEWVNVNHPHFILLFYHKKVVNQYLPFHCSFRPPLLSVITLLIFSPLTCRSAYNSACTSAYSLYSVADCTHLRTAMWKCYDSYALSTWLIFHRIPPGFLGTPRILQELINKQHEVATNKLKWDETDGMTNMFGAERYETAKHYWNID